MPTPKASPAREMIFSVTPEKYINTTANSRLMGMDRAMINVGRPLRRKISSTTIARIPPITRFSSTESMIISI